MLVCRGLGSNPEQLKWFAESERVHCRWAMLAVAGILGQVRKQQLDQSGGNILTGDSSRQRSRGQCNMPTVGPRLEAKS